MKASSLLLCLITLCLFSSCTNPIPHEVDGKPLSLAERQAIIQERERKKGNEMIMGVTPVLYWVGPLICRLAKTGHRSPTLAAEVTRKVRMLDDTRGDLSDQLNTIREQNHVMAEMCSDIFNEINSIQGRPHQSLDERKDLLSQIKRQMERTTLATTKNAEALQNAKQMQVQLNKSPENTSEIKQIQQEIKQLEARASQLQKAAIDLSKEHKQIT